MKRAQDISALKQGMLLIAAPVLNDPNFSRTILLLCEHNEEGTFGLILNRPLQASIRDGVPEVTDWDAPIFQGGPVEPARLHLLHSCAHPDVGGREVLPGLFWGGDFSALNRRLANKVESPDSCRFFVGSAGWSKGQLAGEITLGGWFLRPATRQDIFVDSTVPSGNVWRAAFRSMGPAFSLFSHFPDDPTLN